jgi:hypothetical protein
MTARGPEQRSSADAQAPSICVCVIEIDVPHILDHTNAVKSSSPDLHDKRAYDVK